MMNRHLRTLLIVVCLAGAAGLVCYDILRRLQWCEWLDRESDVGIEFGPERQDTEVGQPAVGALGLGSDTATDAAGDAPLSIEVKPAAKDAEPVHCKAPWEYPGFDKRIKELHGKPLLAVLGNKLSIQLLNNRSVLRIREKPYAGPDFVCAILRGKIVPEREMVYDLQDSQECLVQTQAGEFRVGIYYRPVGYIILPNGESYWFFFEPDRK
jgi:hypothetical protein